MEEIINMIKTMQDELQELREWKRLQERINEREEQNETDNIAEFNAFIADRKAQEQRNQEAAEVIKSMMK